MTDRHLPANANLTYFTVTCHLAPIIADVSQDADYDPNTTRIDATVTFTPKYKTGEVIHSHTSNPPTGFLALPVTAIIDDGYLKLRSKPDLGAAPLPGTLHGLKARIAAENNLEVPEVRAALNYAPVRLLGNSTSLEIEPDQPLYYDFTFSNIKIDNKQTNIVITGGTFEAPWEDTVIDLLDYMPLSPGPYAAPMVVGPQGPQGPPGPATIEVGSTTTSAPGTDAVVTNSGTDQDAVLDFVIPRGDVGPAGALLEFDTVAAFPATGTTGQVYLAKDTGDAYRWDAAAKTNTYVRISERVSAVGIEDSSEVGRAVVTAADELAARTAITAERQRVLNVADFGVDLTGATPSDAAFQAVLNAASANAAQAGGVCEVYIPPGTVSLTGTASVPAGVRVRGAGLNATTVTSPASTGVFRLAGQSNITLCDMGIVSTGPLNTTAVAGFYVGLQERVSIVGCRITGDRGVRFGSGAVRNLTVQDNTFQDCPTGGFTHAAPTIASGLISSQIIVINNRFRNVGRVNISFFGPNSGDVKVSTVHNVLISGNDMRDFNQTSHPDGPIPMEPSGITNLRIIGNVIEGPATRGISTGSNVNAVFANNTIRKQSLYAFELGGGRNITITGNTVEDCTALAQETSNPDQTRQVRLSDLVVANNVYSGSGNTAARSASAISLKYAQRVRITNNLFTDWQYLDSAIIVGAEPGVVAEDVVVEANTFVITSPNTSLYTIEADYSLRTKILRNTICVNRDVLATDRRAITAVMRAESSDILIEGNHISFNGSLAAANVSLAGIGNNVATGAACPRLTVRRNTVVNGYRGMRLDTTSTDLVVDDNDTSTCAAANVIPATATYSAHHFGSLEVGHATDSTLSRVSAGVLAVENVQLSRAGHTHTATEVLGAHSWSTVPATAASTGTAGQMAYDAGFLYIAVGANQWRRVALTTW